jgi:negative regulator of flagellin synthesis FlgM
MTEKINGQGFRPSDTASTRRAETAKPAAREGNSSAAAAEPSAATGDTVNITASGLLLSKLEDIVHGTPVVDAARVAALKDAIGSGTYQVDDQRVADRILRFERDVLG